MFSRPFGSCIVNKKHSSSKFGEKQRIIDGYIKNNNIWKLEDVKTCLDNANNCRRALLPHGHIICNLMGSYITPLGFLFSIIYLC